jgi:hypothetical protein
MRTKEAGWEIVFDYGPDVEHSSLLGIFETCDGIDGAESEPMKINYYATDGPYEI